MNEKKKKKKKKKEYVSLDIGTSKTNLPNTCQ